MLISKLAFIATLGLRAAAYPAGRPDGTGFDASMALRPGGSTSQGPGGYDSSPSGSQTGQRRPKTKNPKRDGPRPLHLLPSKKPGPRLPPGVVPVSGQPKQYTKRHEGHDSEHPQGAPSAPSSKPGSTGNSRDDYSGAPERPDRDQSGRNKSDHREHDHSKPGKDGKDSKGRDGKGSGRKDDKPGRDGKGDGGKQDEASPTSKPSTPMPSKSVESTTSGVPTPSASLKPDNLADSGY